MVGDRQNSIYCFLQIQVELKMFYYFFLRENIEEEEEGDKKKIKGKEKRKTETKMSVHDVRRSLEKTKFIEVWSIVTSYKINEQGRVLSHVYEEGV